MSASAAYAPRVRRLLRAPGFWTLVTVALFGLALLFLVYPFAGLFLRSFVAREGGALTLANYHRFFTFPYYSSTLRNSFVVSTTTTVLAVLIGVPMGYAVARFNVAGKKILNTMVVISLLSPPFIGAYSWIMLFGRAGFITTLLREAGIVVPTIYGLRGLLLVFTLKLFPFVYMYVSGALGSMDGSLEEAAQNLGSGALKRLFTVTFPLILPTISAAAVIVFMTSLADLGTPMLIGEGYKVLPVLVYEEYMSEVGGNAAMASTLSVVIVACSLGVLLLQKLLIARRSYAMTGLRPPAVRNLAPLPRFLVTAACFLVALLSLAPQITTVVISFLKTRGPLFFPELSLGSYTAVWFKLSRNIARTFSYSTAAIAAMVILGVFAAYLIVRRRSRTSGLLDFLIMSPYVIPGSVLGIVLITAFNTGPLVLTGTPLILIISYTIRKIPYILRSSTGILYQLDPSVEEASINLGVPPVRTFFKTTLIMMLPGVLSGAVLSWIATINELSSTLILYSGRTGTISVAIYTELMKDSYGTAAALASILTAATVLSLALFYRLTEGKGSVV